MSDGVCLDTSVIVKLLVPEPLSGAAAALVTGTTEVVAPAFVWAEVGNVLTERVRRGALRSEEAAAAWEALLRLGVSWLQTDGVMRRAWEMAGEFGLPTLYDAAFLAVAELAPGGPYPFWTADDRLHATVCGRHSLARRLGSPPGDASPRA